MFDSETLNKHGGKFLINRFINVFRGSGKTTCVLEQAKRCVEKGEKVLIVTNHTWIMKNEVEGNLTYMHMDKVLKDLWKYPIDGNEWTNREPEFVPPIFLKCFNGYDRVFIEPACYEEIILFLLNRVGNLNKTFKKILKDF